MGNFNSGDKVQINAVNHSQHGVQGYVSQVFEDGETYLVDLETGRTSGFFEKELELVHPERESLTRLAETLYLGLQQANANDITSGQDIYGEIRSALIRVLALLTDAYQCQRVYDEVINSGFSIREALKWAEEQ